MRLVSLVLAFFVFAPSVFAQNKVVVIPMLEDSADGLANIITVSAENGDFNSVEDALDSIYDNGPDNRYLIAIGPGNYFVRRPLVLEPFVEIRGSGRNVTKLLPKITGDNSAAVVARGSIPSTNQANFVGDAEIVISDLTIEHVLSEDNTATTVIDNRFTGQGTLVIRDSNLFINGTIASQGARLSAILADANIQLSNTRLNMSCPQCALMTGLSGGPSYPTLTLNNSSSIIVDGSSADVSGISYDSAILQMDDSEIQVVGRTSVGIQAFIDAASGLSGYVRRSSIMNRNYHSDSDAQYDAIAIQSISDSGIFSISQSTIRGSVRAPDQGTVACIASDDSFGRALNESCLSLVTEPLPEPE